jgi:transcriptional regulator with XRE-family HTH domain
MKQPELGQKVHEIRSQKGLTQKELSDSCNVDIRTIQRIESGEVIPRWSTIRILAAALDCDEKVFNVEGSRNGSPVLKQTLLFSCIIGIIYFINWILYNAFFAWILDIPVDRIYVYLSIIHLVSAVLFFYGFYVLAISRHNKILQIAALVIMIAVPLYVISDIVAFSLAYSFMVHVKQLLVIILGINGIVFGVGLLIAKPHFTLLYKVTGILQILIAPSYIIPLTMVQTLGLLLTVPFILLLISILGLEYRASSYSAVSKPM